MMRTVNVLSESELESIILMEGGVWQWLKHKVGKLGSLEKGGKIFGSGKRAEKAKQQFVDQFKGNTNKIGQGLDAALRGAMEEADTSDNKENFKEFPNGPDGDIFMKMLEKAFLASDVYIKGLKNPAEKIIAVEAFQRWIKFYMDYALSDVYKHFESKDAAKNVILDHRILQAEHEVWKRNLLREQDEEDLLSGESETWKGLNDTTLPKILGGLSMIAGMTGYLAAGLLKKAIAEETAAGAIKIIKETVSGEAAIETMAAQVIKKTEFRNVLQTVQDLHGDSLKDAMTKMGGGDLQQGCTNALAAAGINDPSAASNMAEQITKGAKKAVDLQGKAFDVIVQPHQIKKKVAVTVLKTVLVPVLKKAGVTIGVTKVVTAGASSLGAAALIQSIPALAMLSSVAMPAALTLGIGAGLIKALRSKGKKSSRAATLQGIHKQLKADLEKIKKEIGEEASAAITDVPLPSPPPPPERGDGGSDGSGEGGGSDGSGEGGGRGGSGEGGGRGGSGEGGGRGGSGEGGGSSRGDDDELLGDLEDAISDAVYEALGGIQRFKDNRDRRNKTTNAITKLMMRNTEVLDSKKSIRRIISGQYRFAPKTLGIIVNAVYDAAKDVEEESGVPATEIAVSPSDSAATGEPAASPSAPDQLTDEEIRIKRSILADLDLPNNDKRKVMAAVNSRDPERVKQVENEFGIKLERFLRARRKNNNSGVLLERWNRLAGLI